VVALDDEGKALHDTEEAGKHAWHASLTADSGVKGWLGQKSLWERWMGFWRGTASERQEKVVSGG
jgi:hypothetical protein